MEDEKEELSRVKEKLSVLVRGGFGTNEENLSAVASLYSFRPADWIPVMKL